MTGPSVTTVEQKQRKAQMSRISRPSADLRVRRNVLSLSKADIRRLAHAFDTLKRNHIYDTFVERHVNAMEVAHRGSLFLPWHRTFVEEMESALIAIQPAISALPYWAWEKSSGRRALWTADAFGPDGDPKHGDRVRRGPFAHWRALILNVSTGRLEPRQTEGLVRRLGQEAARLPTQNDVELLYELGKYDDAPWNTEVNSFRNRCEGWSGPGTHNLVHHWIGGDMTAGTSPNDPVFFLVHANVDRIWWNWQQRWGIDNYQGPPGRGPADPMPYLQDEVTPADVFDIHSRGYTYA